MPNATIDLGKLYGLLRTLVVPDERPRVLPTLLRRRRPLPRPMICLVTEDLRTTSPLPNVNGWLGTGHGRTVPRGLADVKVIAEDTTGAGVYELDGEQAKLPYLRVLNKLANDISSYGTAMGPIRFPRYRVADWITRQHLPDTQADIAADELRRRLPRLLRGNSLVPPIGPVSGLLGGVVEKFAAALLSLWPVLRLWMFIGGVVPGFSSESRWFMHQRYMAPELSDNFLAFATRLTEPHRERENAEQVAKLLVHAFLADLRAAYRRRIWRPSSWRRTAYPIALIENLTEDSAGADLLRWVTEIRNETGLFDPLVIIARLDYKPFGKETYDLDALDIQPPRMPLDELGRDYGLPGSTDPLRRWQFEIENMRRNRWAYAWLLLFHIEGPPRQFTGIDPHLARPPAPPLAARKWFVLLAVLIPLSALLTAAVITVPALRNVPCAEWPWTKDIAVQEHAGECLGYSDNAKRVFSGDAALTAMQREVFEQNGLAKQKHAADERRELISLVYFAGLTYSDSTRYPRGVVEELAGLALEQRRLNSQQDSSLPLVRIIVANGGVAMKQSAWVVDHMLAKLLRDDPGVLGVIGLDRSTKVTLDAVTKLGRLGVPMVATTLSADQLPDASKLYLQEVPANRSQAQLIADYVQGARVPRDKPETGQRIYNRVRIYYPDDPNDIYVNSLVEDLRQELATRRIDADRVTWSDQTMLSNTQSPCQTDTFDRHTLLFFAGRNEDFGAFGRAVTKGCQSDNLPEILGGDTVTRLIADPNATNGLPANLTVRYVAKGARVILSGRTCMEGGANVGNEVQSVEFLGFCTQIKRLSVNPAVPDLEQTYKPLWPGDRTGLAYDAVGMFEAAVQRALLLRPNHHGEALDRIAVALALRQSFKGVTGDLTFSSSSQVVAGSAMGILVTAGIEQLGEQRCLLMFPRSSEASGRGADGCPAGTHSDTEDWAADH
ncbi:hypothetical protein GFY24_30920 [Nocardia sp. SYP-A9097]|uniref:hypothetical protein n=1 Tax=Nocardia sp. SYP-A9097 TaxID=2663237 RepID=UPI00129B36F3|nr:hypothetical protein [Nocardia sp. SYP-A9097]MRH91800.1 hypothetical protein [Nocardia sp. SYP-A9097]